MSFFKVIHNSSKSKARLGTITTDHGVINTPAFVPVGTKGTIKGLTQEQIKDLNIQASFVNTYHLVTHPGVDVLEKAGGIHSLAHYTIPLMSDSGGFQVFSLAQRERINNSFVIPVKTGIQEKVNYIDSVSEHGMTNNQRICLPIIDWIPASAGMTNKTIKLQNNKRIADVRGDEKPLVEKISEDGVMFRSVYDGQLINFTPETSMDFQKVIGADINMAFDECTYHPATHEYTEKAMNRTHEWLERCIKHRSVIPVKTGIQEKVNYIDSVSEHGMTNNQRICLPIIDRIPASAGMTQNTTNHYPLVTSHQYLYGIIQGGTYEDLRKKSAEFVLSQNTPGIAIGGVSVGETKTEMRSQVKWVAPYLPKDRPVHLLGVGQVDDIVDLVGQGIDTFDCVEPTRLARMGCVYDTKNTLGYVETHCNASLQKNEFNFDINKSIYKADLNPLDENCSCSTCINFSKAYIHHLFKQRELLGYTLLSLHNLFVMERLMTDMRELITQDRI